MTRFWITLDEAVRFVVKSFTSMQGGELFVPRIPSMRLSDLVEAIAPEHPTTYVGIRPGEKLHEEMISADDAPRTYRQARRYVIAPTGGEWGFKLPEGKPVQEGFSYRSDNNDQWLSSEELRSILDPG